MGKTFVPECPAPPGLSFSLFTVHLGVMVLFDVKHLSSIKQC